ncbi:putative reverse transcriptase domain-containing protein [Tanacetum coccineum]
MDWLAYHRALIDCYEKIVRIPLPNGKILEVQGERPEKDLRSLACIKADEKKLDDIRVVRDFPEVFPDDLLGLPLVREIEFHIDLIPCASPVVRSPYRRKLCNAPVLALPVGPGDFLVYYEHQNTRFWVRADVRSASTIGGGLRCTMILKNVLVAGIEERLAELTVDHLLPIREDYKTEKLAKIYTNEIVARHGVSVSIILDREGRFTSHLWQAFQEALGMRLDMSMAYHPQTDGQRKIGVARKSARKCYADKRSKPLECQVGVRVLLKVSPGEGSALCYPKMMIVEILGGSVGTKGDIGFFHCYLLIPVLTGAMAFEQSKLEPGSSKPMTSGKSVQRLRIFTYAPQSTITTQKPIERELDLLFEAMHDDYIGGQPSSAQELLLAVKQTPKSSSNSTATTNKQQDTTT